MTLSIVALVVFLAALVAAAVLLWRRLPGASAAAAGEVACVACGTPGRQLATDSFICPGCRRDVRDLGLALPRPWRAVKPLWRAAGFSAGFCVLAVVGTALWVRALPDVEYVSGGESASPSGMGYQFLEFTFRGRRVARGAVRGPLEGEVTADLLLTNGEVFTLEVQSPSLRYRVIDTTGREVVPLSADGAFNEAAVLRWKAAAGLDPAHPYVRGLARMTYTRIYEKVGRHGRLLPVSPVPPAEELGTFTAVWSPNHIAAHGSPPYALPAAVIFWSLLWLAGLWLVVPRGRPSPPADPAAEGVPA